MLIEQNRRAALERRRRRLAQGLQAVDGHQEQFRDPKVSNLGACGSEVAKENAAPRSPPTQFIGATNHSLLDRASGAAPAEVTPVARPGLTLEQLERIEQNRLAAMKRKQARELPGTGS